jgi:two-component system, LuxR family, sensor kinase FixL
MMAPQGTLHNGRPGPGRELDATPRAEASDAAGETEARYHALFEGSMDAIYLSRSDGRVLRVNPAFLSLFGYTAEELQSASAQDYYANPTDRERFHEAITATGAVRDFEVQLRRRDGSVRDCLITSTARRTGDGGIEYQGIIRDVTEERRAQAELERMAEALRRSNADLEQFAYVASHDLQEPLRKIRAFGGRLGSMLGDRLDERAADYLGRMVGAAERMQTLIENLLSYSRVSSRGGDFSVIELDSVLEDVLVDLERQVAATGARVRVGPLPRLQADAVQMRQLFQNLVSNALKYGPPDGSPEISIAAEHLDRQGRTVTAGPAAEVVRIRLSDNGIGFEPEYAERIFELFQRLHGREQYEGTGIGLGVCRRIVSRHGGTISAEGRPGHGATFTVTLPFTQENERDA